MTERELFRQAFDGLHASGNTYEEVLMKLREDRGPRQALTRRAAIIALVGTLACGGTAYAVGSGLFANAFGNKGRDDIPAAVIGDDKGGTITMPAMQFVDVSEEDVARILGDSVQHVGLSCTSHGYALSIEDLVVDEQGAGVATFTLTAPDGVGRFVGGAGDYPDYGFLNYVEDEGLRGIALQGADGGLYDHYEVVDLTQTTDDVLHGVMYFGAMEVGPSVGMTFGLAGQDMDEVDPQTGDWEPWDVETDAFVPSTTVPGMELVDADGHTAHVSPVAITFAGPFGEMDHGNTWVPHGTTVLLADGSAYVVDGDDLVNTYCGYYTTEGSMTLVFNRLVDPSQVVGVTVDGPDGTPLEFTLI